TVRGDDLTAPQRTGCSCSALSGLFAPSSIDQPLLQDLLALTEAEAVVAEEERAALVVQADDLVAGGEDVAGREVLVHGVVDPDVGQAPAAAGEDRVQGDPLGRPGGGRAARRR